MQRVVIMFTDGSHLNLPADCIDLRDGWVMAWNGDALVVMCKADIVEKCYISEKKEG